MDNTGDGRWLTYAELATIRGINRASAVKLVQRERWPRSSGNDRLRTVRVLVPEDWLTPAKETPRSSGDGVAGSGEYAGMLAAIEAAHRGEIDALRGQVGAKDGEIATLRGAVDGLRDTVSRAEHRAQHAEARATEAETQARDATEAARIATDALNVARRADEARKARGRLRRAWDGWRGR
jgi:hypothetical protein